MKKFLAIVLAALMGVLLLVSCTAGTGSSTAPNLDAGNVTGADLNEAAGSDLQAIKDKGVLVVGITLFMGALLQPAGHACKGFGAFHPGQNLIEKQQDKGNGQHIEQHAQRKGKPGIQAAGDAPG